MNNENNNNEQLTNNTLNNNQVNEVPVLSNENVSLNNAASVNTANPNGDTVNTPPVNSVPGNVNTAPVNNVQNQFPNNNGNAMPNNTMPFNGMNSNNGAFPYSNTQQTPSKNNTLIIIVICVVVALALVVGLVLFNKDKKDDNKSKDNNTNNNASDVVADTITFGNYEFEKLAGYQYSVETDGMYVIAGDSRIIVVAVDTESFEQFKTEIDEFNLEMADSITAAGLSVSDMGIRNINGTEMYAIGIDAGEQNLIFYVADVSGQYIMFGYAATEDDLVKVLEIAKTVKYAADKNIMSGMVLNDYEFKFPDLDVSNVQ